MDKRSLIIYATLFIFSGCTHLNLDKPKIPQEKKIDIKNLNQKIEKLNDKDKRTIYQSIKKEVLSYQKQGDEDYRNSHYYDALQAYKRVNFYEGNHIISKKRIRHIEQKASKKASFHYKKANKYLPKDKKRALRELNIVMMNNPEYKDTKELYKRVKNDKNMQIYLNGLKNRLDTQIANYTGEYKELKKIYKSFLILSKYDYKNRSVLKAKTFLKEQNDNLKKEALELYKSKKFTSAKKKFKEILTIYPYDKEALNYFNKIKFRQSKQKNIQFAQKMLKKQQYNDAKKYALKVLQLEPNNKEAKKIIYDADQKSKKEIRRFLSDGIRYYNSKNLKLAKKSFEKVLQIDKKNSAALIYNQKIQRQLQTIESLQ